MSQQATPTEKAAGDVPAASSTTAQSPTFTALKPDAEGYAQAGKLLREGRLVAFPTETVYGLGANALDEDAVRSIFTCKGRPLTDPLIVHIPDPADAEDLVQLDEKSAALFAALTTKFWPGPLTIVAKAKPKLPLLLSAGTGFVGIRCPNHPVALAMLRAAGVPVSAPSANRFGHVSPTLAAHVVKDLGHSTVGGGIAVIDNDNSSASTASCGVGIESTVAKIDADAHEIVVFRRGGISQAALQSVLDEGQFDFQIRCLSKKASESQKGLQAPGQMLTHYAPDVETFLIRDVGVGPSSEGPDSAASAAKAVVATPVDDAGAPISVDGQELTTTIDLSKSVVIDFNGALSKLKDLGPLAYRDMSEVGRLLPGRCINAACPRTGWSAE